MSAQSGQSNGYSLQQPTPANPNGYGGANMRYGDPIGSPSNWGYAQQNLPGTPFSYQEQAAGLYGTPFQSDPNQYGRWNWASQMRPPSQSGGNPYTPPTGTPGTGTPPPASGGGTTQPPVQPPGQPNGTGGVSAGTGLFGMTQDQMAGTVRNPGAPVGGDVFTNPAFANAVQGTGGNGIFGPSAASQQLQQQKVQDALARRAARGQ